MHDEKEKSNTLGTSESSKIIFQDTHDFCRPKNDEKMLLLISHHRNNQEARSHLLNCFCSEMKTTTLFLQVLSLSKFSYQVASFVVPTRNNNHRQTIGTPFNIVPNLSSSSSLNFFNKNMPEPEPVPLIQGVGEEGCNLPSPSGVNTLPETIQAGIFFGIFVLVGAMTVPFSSFLDDITMKYEFVQSWRYTWPLLGAIYAAAGVTPSILRACPKVFGLISLNFDFISFDKPDKLS